MTDPTHEQPPTLVERLRNTAINLTTTYVAVDANGDPIGQPRDGSEEADFEQFDDPVEFEPEELHDLANLYREAATALVAHESEILSRDERIAILESQIAATRKQAFFGALHDPEFPAHAACIEQVLGYFQAQGWAQAAAELCPPVYATATSEVLPSEAGLTEPTPRVDPIDVAGARACGLGEG